MNNDTKERGRVTIPTDKDFTAETLRIMQTWGADAIRDCDGTELGHEIMDAAEKVYKTYFVTRGDNAWAANNPDERQHFYVMSERFSSSGDDRLVCPIMQGYLREQIAPDYDSDPTRYWEVIDRTTGEVLRTADWRVDAAEGTVTVFDPKPFHEYTVGFLAYTLWDSTQMYNYITNNWTKQKETPYDPRGPKTRKYLVENMRAWLSANPQISVVRFTTFLYHFTLLFNEERKEKFVDWFGYSASVGPRALEEFAREYGYRLRPEDFIDEGYYNSPFRVPSRAFSDYMDFTQRFVCKVAKELVDEVHAAGREAMMFLGDTWIGTEPYGKYFESIGLDAVVGSVGGGVTVRMLSDMPGVKYTEGRFLPYFFPDTFHKGGKPVEELDRNWLSARRAILRKPIDRIGYGGYLSLAAQFPDFIARVGEICDEFRDLYAKVKDNAPYSGLTVGIVNSWGKLRSWQCYMVAHELWYKQIYAYQGILEALSGMDVQVKFLSFDDIETGGVPQSIDVLLCAGDAGTAFSGGKTWLRPRLIATVRAFIQAGGGFVGIGEPSACDFGGRYFQLADALGVERERGFSLSTDKYNTQAVPHFITEGMAGPLDCGEVVNNIYALPSAAVLQYDKGNVTMAANTYGAGRSFYAMGLPYNAQNTALLRRALFWCAGKEDACALWAADNESVEVNYYPDTRLVALVNNTAKAQNFVWTDGNGIAHKQRLGGGELHWEEWKP